MLKRFSLLGVLALAAVVLSGCASIIGGVEREYAGLPEKLTEEQRAQIPMGEPSVWWMEEGSTAVLVTWGSSSCPYEVARIEAVSGGEVALRLDVTGGEACTADIAARSHELVLPRNSERPLMVTLIYSDSGTATHLELP